WDTDAAILDGEVEFSQAACRLPETRLDVNFSSGSELNGIPDQVQQDLPQTQRVSEQTLGHCRSQPPLESEAFLTRWRRHEPHCFAQCVADPEHGWIQNHFARLNLRIVEDVVQDNQQGVRGRLDE